jgi:SAM-dependent methyltransferase
MLTPNRRFTPSRKTCREGLEAFIVRHAPGLTLHRLDHIMRGYFPAGEAEGAKVLEVGCGIGLSCAWVACMGAIQVVGLEPETAGSHTQMRARAEQLIRDVNLDASVEIEHATIQEYLSRQDNPRFTHVVMHNVVNHLDEEAVVCLHQSGADWARDRYVELFSQIATLLEPGGTLALSDCSRKNLWPSLGLPSPFAPTIEWYKHQQPRIWMQLLEAAGLGAVRYRWNVPYRLRIADRLLSSGLAAYCFSSHFTLTARRL